MKYIAKSNQLATSNFICFQIMIIFVLFQNILGLLGRFRVALDILELFLNILQILFQKCAILDNLVESLVIIARFRKTLDLLVKNVMFRNFKD